MSLQLATAAVAQDSDSSSVDMLTLGASSGNTANYYGQTTAAKLPYSSFDASFSSKSGLWTAASIIKLLNTGSGISELDLSAGYDFPVYRQLSGSLSYTRFIFAKNSPLPQSINPNTLSAGLAFSWAVKSDLYADFVFGNHASDYYLTFSNSRLFDLGSLFSKKDYLSIEPSVSLTGATQVVGIEDVTAELDASAPGFSGSSGKAKKEKKQLKEKKKLPGPKALKPGDEETTVASYSKLSLLNTNIRLPLAYNRANYSIEASCQLSVPNKNFIGIETKVRSYFTLAFYYSIY